MAISSEITKDEVIRAFRPFIQHEKELILLNKMRDETVLRIFPLLYDTHYASELSMLLSYHSEFDEPRHLWKIERDLSILTVILKNEAYERTGRVWRAMEEFMFFMEQRELVSKQDSPMDEDMENIVLGAYVHWHATSDYPDIDHARWMGANYPRFARYSSELAARGDASREFIEVLLEGSSPALSSGSL